MNFPRSEYERQRPRFSLKKPGSCQAVEQWLAEAARDEGERDSGSAAGILEGDYPTDPVAFLQDLRHKIRVQVASAFEAALARPLGFLPLSNCFQLFGIDFVLDRRRQLYLLEVNSDPSLPIFGPQLRHNAAELLYDTVSVGRLLMDACLSRDHREGPPPGLVLPPRFAPVLSIEGCGRAPPSRGLVRRLLAQCGALAAEQSRAGLRPGAPPAGDRPLAAAVCGAAGGGAAAADALRDTGWRLEDGARAPAVRLQWAEHPDVRWERVMDGELAANHYFDPPRAVAAGERRAGVPRDSLPPGAGRGGGAARGAVGRARPPDAADVARVGRRRRLGRAPGIAVALVQALGRSAVVARPPASTAGDRSEQRWRGAPDHRAAARGAPIGGGGGRRLGRRAAARPRPRRRCPGRASARAPGAPPPRRRLHGVPPRAPDGGGGQPRHHGGGRAGSFSSRGGSSGAGGENGASGGAQCVAHCAGGGVDAALRGLRGREAGGAARAAQLLRGVRRCLCRRRVVRLLAPRLHCGGRPPLMGCPRCPRNGFAADLWRRRCHGLSPSR
uniref:Uncharacterized protein n=1 Tax=Tetraselmis sp. GSL018 TaxID=582737 RepID=A0A061RGI1_9CHLO